MQKNLLCISPYENDHESVMVDHLEIKNGETTITLEGSVSITKDQKGLEHAFALKRQIDTIVEKLKREDLPKTLF